MSGTPRPKRSLQNGSRPSRTDRASSSFIGRKTRAASPPVGSYPARSPPMVAPTVKIATSSAGGTRRLTGPPSSDHRSVGAEDEISRPQRSRMDVPPRRAESPRPSMALPGFNYLEPLTSTKPCAMRPVWRRTRSSRHSRHFSPEHEPDIPLGGHLIALLPVLRGTARIDDEGALLLPRQVGVDAHHPGIDLGEQHAPAGVVDVLGPAPLRFPRCFHADVALLAHVPQERGHPVDVLLD